LQLADKNIQMCKICETKDNLVYSGVDALLLGIDGAETRTICYDCAKQAKKDKASDSAEMPEQP
jgi:hypothetical protein